MGAAETKILQNKTDMEFDEHPLHKEIQELKVVVEVLKKEVEEANAERVDLTRKFNDRNEKYYRLKQKMRQQKEDMQDQFNAVQEEVLYKRYEGMNYYLLYKQTFVIVRGSIISSELFKLMSSSSLLMNYIYF